MSQTAAPVQLSCSFCGKSQHDVKSLIAGPTVFICDECVSLCAQINADTESRKQGAGRLSEAEISAAVQRQKDEEAAREPRNLTTPQLLDEISGRRDLLQHLEDAIRERIFILRDRGVGGGTIQAALGITPEAAIEQFLGRISRRISDPTSADWRADPDAKSFLLAILKRRGYVTYEELSAALPPDLASSATIESAMAMLSEAGVNVVEAGEPAD